MSALGSSGSHSKGVCLVISLKQENLANVIISLEWSRGRRGGGGGGGEGITVPQKGGRGERGEWMPILYLHNNHKND